jgi:hypothetical protein
MENDVHGKTDKSLDKRIDSLFRTLAKAAIGIDEIVFTIKRCLEPNKFRKSSKDHLGMFRKTKTTIERRRAIRGDSLKIRSLQEAIKYVEDVPVLANLSNLYENYDARNIHKKLSEAAFGSDRYKSDLWS